MSRASSARVPRLMCAGFLLFCAFTLACTPRAVPGKVEGTPAGGAATALPSAETPAVEGALPATLVPQPVRGVSVLALRVEHLPPLTGSHYEVWAVLGEQAVSAGTFNIVNEGLVSRSGVPLTAFPLTRDIVEAQRVFVSIEADDDGDSAPSDLVVVSGQVVNGRAMLAFPASTSGLAGGVLLATPTDDDPNNETAGAWFVASGDRAPSLTLAAPPPGWVYEGWIRTQDRLFTVGRFTRGQGPDSAVLTSGPRPGFDAPGEDLLERLGAPLTTPVNLADGSSTVEISLEPDRRGQDPTGPGMFTAPILRARIPSGAAPLQGIPLEVDTSLLPSGVATLG